MTNREYLICIDVKLEELKEQFTNHLRHHFIVTLGACGSALSAIGTLAFYILTQK